MDQPIRILLAKHPVQDPLLSSKSCSEVFKNITHPSSSMLGKKIDVSNSFFNIRDNILEVIDKIALTCEFLFLMLSYSLCRIWTYESKTCTGLQSRKLAEAIFTFFNVEVSRKCVLQDL